MDETINKLKQKLDRLDSERESLFYELGKAYHLYGKSSCNNETEKVSRKLGQVEANIAKVKTAIEEVREASMTV